MVKDQLKNIIVNKHSETEDGYIIISYKIKGKTKTKKIHEYDWNNIVKKLGESFSLDSLEQYLKCQITNWEETVQIEKEIYMSSKESLREALILYNIIREA